MNREYISDERHAKAPKLPTGRPATKKEVWARYHFMYSDLKTTEELTAFCRDAWAWFYVSAVNFSQWDKHPDWVEGQPVIEEAVPSGPFPAGQQHHTEVERLYQIAQAALAAHKEDEAA